MYASASPTFDWTVPGTAVPATNCGRCANTTTLAVGEIAAPPDFPSLSGREDGPEGITLPPYEGAGRLSLYESFPASNAYFQARIDQSRKSGGKAIEVMVCGEATQVWLDQSSGELVVGWTDRNKSDVLVANLADFTVQELVDSAERVYDCCG